MSDDKEPEKEPAKEPEKTKAKEKEEKIDLSKFAPSDHKHEPAEPAKPEPKPENEPKRTPLHSHKEGDDDDVTNLPTELVAEISPMGWILILASVGILVGVAIWYQRTRPEPQKPQVVKPERNPMNVSRPIRQAFQ